MTAQGKISFDNPPVVETVFSVQFMPIQEFSTANVGRYAMECLDKDWQEFKESHRVEDHFERFGEPIGIPRAPSFRILTDIEPNRIQIVRADQQRMIQVQNTRFIFNWKKHESPYPTFEVLFSEFSSYLLQFCNFAKKYLKTEIEFNQWEMTHVNHFLRGEELWSSPTNWSDLLPRLFAADLPAENFETFGGQWSFRLPEDKGRLYLNLNHGRIGTPFGPEALIMNIMARGPIEKTGILPFKSEFHDAHTGINKIFETVTNSQIQCDIWGKK